MSLLLDMLVYQTRLHFNLVRTEGVSDTVQACKESIINIQKAIEWKKRAEGSHEEGHPDHSFKEMERQ